ncbi:AAA family ATPase [Stenoxybacter acetivorans]|uniref:AAA family ATPase n=1 Tax=Stenoxybacter acetivorans TaxID=422441 RepID=UPI0005650825|nr:AAA family ATPase [Stenoxybacter acetivorans]
MNDLSIDLSKFPERFSDKNLSIGSSVGFIFGKNGTGKTTITDCIKEQFSDKYDVRIFKDFSGIAENDKLNAIALGKENAKIQEKIEKIDNEITEIKKETEKSEDRNDNLFRKSENATQEYNEQYEKIENFYQTSAKGIKNQTNPQIAKTSYDKNAFKNEIAQAKLLSNDEIRQHEETIKSEEKKIEITPFPDINLPDFLKTVNEILQSAVSPLKKIDELANNPKKQNFAKQGMEAHEHKAAKNAHFAAMKSAKNGGNDWAVILIMRSKI